MIFTEITALSIDLLYSDLLIVSSVLIISLAVAYHKELRYAGLMMSICGLFHGISYTHGLAGNELLTLQRIQSLFAFNLAIDLGHFLLAGLCLVIFPVIKRSMKRENWVSVAIGGITVCLLLVIFNENISKGKTQILDLGAKKASISIPVTGNSASRQAQRGAGIMTTPIMVFLSIEPYEIRQEILITGNEALAFLHPDHASEVIPVEAQEEMKATLTKIIEHKSEIRINNELQKAAEISANFVQLSRGGVSIRETTVDEPINSSIIGITCIYDISSFPDSLNFNWQFFPNDVTTIETSINDPHGALTAMLDPDNPTINWISRLSGYQLPTVEPIAIEYYPTPLISILIWVFFLIIVAVTVIRKKAIRLYPWAAVLITLTFVLYPFVRTEASIPFMPQWKPSKERTSVILQDLLSNVYRAFDRRKESEVYDRLALSVTGEQLTEIYLQNRQAMALENRGGARANVEEVDLLDVFSIKHADNGSYEVNASWTVRGSVNHFGHTHYRQNLYRAIVTFINENEIWKISSIEAIDEKRIY